MILDAIVRDMKSKADAGIAYADMIVTMAAETKLVMELELKSRDSFKAANGRKLSITCLRELDATGRVQELGWVVPVEVSQAVPLGQVWIGVRTGDEEGTPVGGAIPGRLWYPGRN